MSTLTLSASNMQPITFYGDSGSHDVILRGLDGWLDTTSAKTELSERAAGDGAHDVPALDVMYASRVITISFRLLAMSADDRAGVLANLRRIRRLLHSVVTVRVQDGFMDLDAHGYVQSVDVDQEQQNVNWQYLTGQLSIVCPRPELVQHDLQRFTLHPPSAVSQGLSYGDKLATWWEGEPNNSVSVLEVSKDGSSGLVYPISYGVPGGDGRNRGAFTNNGSSRAYPVLTIEGAFKDGVRFLVGGKELVYARGTSPMNPVTIDFRSRTVTCAGVGVSQYLVTRVFPTVPPGSSLGIVLLSEGTGHVTCQCGDTYI